MSRRLIPYAAAPMPMELLKRAMARFKCEFARFYEQTETGPLSTLLRPQEHMLDGSRKQLAGWHPHQRRELRLLCGERKKSLQN